MIAIDFYYSALKRLFSLLTPVICTLCVLLGSGASIHAAPSTTIVISQLYGGGGNAGATYKNDFIELHNISGNSVDVTGWSVQYTSSTGTTWQVTNVSGTIPAGGYYLVQESQGAGGTTNLPTPDATGTIAMSATAGKVALANSTTALSGANPSGAQVVDLVGFGGANGFEGSPVGTLTNTTAALRNNSGSTDTDNNASDFTVGAPAPRNSASPPFIPGPVAAKIVVETAADGSGANVPAQTIAVGSSITVYAISRSSSNVFIANAAATWSLTSVTGGVVSGDLVPAGDNKSAVFTPHADGSAVIHVGASGLTSVDSGTITASATPSDPTAVASADSTSVSAGQQVLLTVTVTPGLNPTSTGIVVSGDLSAVGGSATQSFTEGPANTFTYQVTVPSNQPGGPVLIPISVQDAQSRSASASVTLNVHGSLTIFHTNDTHARVTPHHWIIPQHSSDPFTQFEEVGGASYLVGEMLSLVGGQPDALVLDGGDISEGNPLGDWNGPGNPIGTFGNGIAINFYEIMDSKLRNVPGRGGRGLDAMVVGNHDIRNMTYLNNMKDAANSHFPILSINICNKGTHTPYFQPYVIINLNGNKIGIVGYTTETADSNDPVVNSTIDVVKCDWKSSDSTKIHFSDYVNTLRNTMGCNMVILLTHDGHSDLCARTDGTQPILVDDPANGVLPEIAVTGHWHTYADTLWQPEILNYKTIFTESGSFMHYIGELHVDGRGKYLSTINHPLRDSEITPDPDMEAFLDSMKTAYAAASPPYQLEQVIGYTDDDLLLDNRMKWWSSDEFPWSGDNTAGGWICDAMQWKAQILFGQCDLAVEAGGGVRSDIPAGPVTYTEIYETFPWADDTIYEVNMTGQEIWDYIKGHDCDAAISRGWKVTAFDGNPTSITYNGQPVDLAHTYKVAINNYMYTHDTVPFSDPNPQTSTYLARTALVDYESQFGAANPYKSGGLRYSLNTQLSGGYRVVVTMLNDADSAPAFDDAFVRFISAVPETMGHRGTQQVPTSFVNADGSINLNNRLAENELYRSYLGFKTGVLHPGDIIETYGKAGFFGGDPEFVDQEGIQSDGVEFKIVGHDDSLAQPTFFSSIGSFFNQIYKNHYVKFFAKKTGTSIVTDQNGTSISIEDVTGFALKTLPGNVGDLLQITGVPTSESFGLRFRANSAVVASTAGITGFPPDSHVLQPASSTQTSSPLVLSAMAAVAPGADTNIFALSPVADSQVVKGSPTGTNGTRTFLFVQSAATGSFQDERSWLRFDLSSVPAGSTISSAKLKMYCWKAVGAAMSSDLCTSANDSWIENSVTWNNQPSFGSPIDQQTLAAGAINVWYSWDATSFAQSEFAGDKQVSLLVKPTSEGSTDATSPSYGFESREFTSNTPYLEVRTPASGSVPTVTQVQFYYRYSTDKTTWTPWTVYGVSSSDPWTISFNYPAGEGYYEFYSVATDSAGNVEPAPAFADAAVLFTTQPLPDLAVSVSAPTTAYAGNPINYTLTASNIGTADASGVKVQFQIPTGLAYASASGASGFTASESDGLVTFTGGALTAGSSAALTVTTSAASVGTYTAPDNAALIDPDNDIVEADEAHNGSLAVTTNVISNTPPALHLPSNITAEATSAAGAVVTFTVTADDVEDGPLTPTVMPDTGSTFPLGDTTVNVSVTDSQNSTTTSSFLVTVQDTTAPEIAAPAGGFSPLTLASGAALPDYRAQAVASDNVGVTNVTQSPVPGTVVGAGTVQVTLTAFDAVGHSASTSFDVSVNLESPAYSTVAAKGGDVPGAGVDPRIGVGALWKSFGVPALSQTGEVAVLGNWAVKSKAGAGIFAGNPLALVIAKGETAPGTNGAVFTSFGDPVINRDTSSFGSSGGTGGINPADAGGSTGGPSAIAFNGKFAKPTKASPLTIDGTNNFGIWTNAGGALTLVARKGDVAPGTGGGVFKALSSFTLVDNELLVAATLIAPTTKAPNAPGGITKANDVGVWRWTSSTGLGLLLREGQTVPSSAGDKVVSVFQMLGTVSGSPGHGRHHVAAGTYEVRVVCTDKTVIDYLIDATGATPVFQSLAETGQALLPGLLATTVGVPSGNSEGEAAFQEGFKTAKGGPTTADNAAIFSNRDGGWGIVVRKGSVATSNDTWKTFKDPILDETGDVAWIGTLGGTATSANKAVLGWSPEGGAPQIVARQGSLAAGAEGGVFGAFTSVALPDGGLGPLFTATLESKTPGSPATPPGPGGVTTANDTGLWCMDSTGNIDLLLREGQTLSGNTVKSFKVIANIAGSPGQTRSFNASHEVVVNVTFADRSQSLVTITVP